MVAAEAWLAQLVITPFDPFILFATACLRVVLSTTLDHGTLLFYSVYLFS